MSDVIYIHNVDNRDDFPLDDIEYDSVEIDEDNGSYPIRDIFQFVLDKYHLLTNPAFNLSSDQRTAAYKIANCKTGNLGYNASYCPNCKKVTLHTCSCGNRMCPNCQSLEEQMWVENRKAEVIPDIAHFHGVATVPSELNQIAYLNKELIYPLVQRDSANAIIKMCRSQKHGGFTTAVTSVLHTSGSDLKFHLHSHMIIPGGGLTPFGKFVETSKKDFFLPEKAVAAVFRGMFMEDLKKLYDDNKLVLPDPAYTEGHVDLSDRFQWMNFCDKLYREDWVFYIKETYNGHGNAIEYLGRYVFHTAIKNSRIVSFSAGDEEHPHGLVVFNFKDYRVKNAQGYEWKKRKVSPLKFVLLFLQHVLPKGYSRVRYFGFLANSVKTKSLALIAKLRAFLFTVSFLKGKSKAEAMQLLYGKDICHCPICGGRLVPRGKLFASEVIRFEASA